MKYFSSLRSVFTDCPLSGCVKFMPHHSGLHELNLILHSYL